MITYKSEIEKIVLDIKFAEDKKYYKDVTLDYSDCNLSLVDIHYEENDSWHAIDLDDHHYDVQFFGEDDELARDGEVFDVELECERPNYNDRKAMTIPIHIQFGGVDKTDDGYWEHNGEWLTTDDVKVRNVRVYTKDGMKRIKVC